MKPNQQTVLSESLIPNSVAYKNSSLEKAKEVLLIAKSIPRTVRRASQNECEFSREIEKLKNSGPKQNKYREDHDKR